MNILFIASTDSYNTELLPLALEAKSRGHNALILTTTDEDSHTRMLVNDEVECIAWKDYTSEIRVDAIVYGNILNPEARNKIRQLNCLKIGLFFHLVIDDYVLGGENIYADFTLCYGNRFIQNQIKNGLVHNLVAVGPPHDNVEDKEATSTESRNILFLEQHFYPSGDKGKQQLADFLVNLAKEHPNYSVTVKPRALESDENPGHKARHIYSYIKSTPENLHLLKTHFDLEKAVEKADIVITTFSTAAVPAILKNKKVIFVNGFSMRETQYYNKATVNKYYDIYKSCGNLINFNDVSNKLESIDNIDEKFKKNLIYSRKCSFSTSVIDFIEYSIAHKDKHITNCTIDNYKEVLAKASTRDRRDIYNNIALEKFYLLNLISGFRLEKYRIALLKMLRSLKEAHLNPDTYQSTISNICDELIEDGISYLLAKYKKHPVGFKGYYLKRLYHAGDEAACDKLPTNWRIADYYYNKYLFNANNQAKAKRYLGKYLEIAKKEDYKLTHLYETNFIRCSEAIYDREFG